MEDLSSRITDSEDVARILSKDWVSDNVILHMAFTLRDRETYISVNRPAVSSYDNDIASFVKNHPAFYADEAKTSYMRALINVKDIRQTEVRVGNVLLDIDVEVEPRDTMTKSHAGIFARYEGKNIKANDVLFLQAVGKEISADEVLLEIRSHLIDQATLETCTVKNLL